MPSSDRLYDAILYGDEPSANDKIDHLLANGIAAEDVLHKSCIPASQEARLLVEQGEFYIPDLFIALRAYRSVLETLQPHLSAESYQQALSYGEFDITCHL